MRTLSSPKENIAEKVVLVVQDAQTQIKETIVESTYTGLSKSEIENRIRLIIEEAAEEIPEAWREQARQALAINAQKWHYLYTKQVQAINAQMIAAAADKLKQPSVRIKDKTYSINLQSVIGLPVNEQMPILTTFREHLTVDRAGLALIENYDKQIRARVKSLAVDPAYFQRIDKNGKVYRPNLRNFAEMQARYESNVKDVKNLEAEGVKLVWTSSHPDASPRCAPYQGRLYSLDGSSGTIDGIKYTPLSEALAGPRGDGNGIISGYNCRHRLIEYTPKSKPPKEYDRATIRKENAINNRQRQYERDIRNLKIEERLMRRAGDEQTANQLKNEWLDKTKQYEIFSLRAQRAYYPWRTKVTNEEIERANQV